jgi:hypothetical protein
VVLDEFNVFIWPGYDLRPIKNKYGRIDYGFLPPKVLLDQPQFSTTHNATACSTAESCNDLTQRLSVTPSAS